MTAKVSAVSVAAPGTIRPATGADHAAFVRLFPELLVDDPVMDGARFERELVPTTLVLEQDGHVMGYTYFQLLGRAAYVRHLVTAPQARRRGLGRALLAALLARARDAGCTSWCLNVKPDNTAAIALYEGMGLARAHTSKALFVPWSTVPEAHEPGLAARIVVPDEDAEVETATGLLEGQLAKARALGGRVLVGLFEDREGATLRVVGASIFDPQFPGAYPFRVARERPELAFVLLQALRPFARSGDVSVQVVCEGQPEVAEVLLAAGATLKLDIQHMAGAIR